MEKPAEKENAARLDGLRKKTFVTIREIVCRQFPIVRKPYSGKDGVCGDSGE